MGPRLTALTTATVLVLATGAAAAMIGIYRNGMGTTAQRGQLVKLSGRNCIRGGLGGALRIELGKRTSECSYRTPVLGRDLEIGATERLLSGTPKPLQRKVFLGLELRAGGGARYQLAVYPAQDKVQLRKQLSDGTVRYLDIEKSVAAVKGVGQANQLRLRAINVADGEERGSCRLLAFLGDKRVAEATDPAGGELSGRASGVSVGSAANATGALASVDDVVVRVPSPF